jgi:hypothetical protein
MSQILAMSEKLPESERAVEEPREALKKNRTAGLAISPGLVSSLP